MRIDFYAIACLLMWSCGLAAGSPVRNGALTVKHELASPTRDVAPVGKESPLDEVSGYSEAIEQVKRSTGQDYKKLYVAACSNTSGALAQFIKAGAHTDGAGAEGHGFLLAALLARRGDVAFAREVAPLRIALRRSTLGCLETGTHFRPPDTFAQYMQKNFPKTLAALTK